MSIRRLVNKVIEFMVVSRVARKMGMTIDISDIWLVEMGEEPAYHAWELIDPKDRSLGLKLVYGWEKRDKDLMTLWEKIREWVFDTQFSKNPQKAETSMDVRYYTGASPERCHECKDLTEPLFVVEFGFTKTVTCNVCMTRIAAKMLDFLLAEKKEQTEIQEKNNERDKEIQ